VVGVLINQGRVVFESFKIKGEECSFWCSWFLSIGSASLRLVTIILHPLFIIVNQGLYIVVLSFIVSFVVIFFCFYASKDIQSSKFSVMKDNLVRWIGFPVFQSLSFQSKVGDICDIDRLAVFSDSIVNFVYQSDNLFSSVKLLPEFFFFYLSSKKAVVLL